MSLRFSIGYYRNNEWGDSIQDVLTDYPEVSEIYFPLPDQHSGRLALNANSDTFSVREELHNDLEKFHRQGKSLNLLLNAGCYSSVVQDSSYIDNLKKLISFYVEEVGVNSITTTQPSFAVMVKRMYGNRVETRASINMFVSSIDSMHMLSGEFDAFYPMRELYRSMEELTAMRRWADENGKHLYALVNSGCLAGCPWAIVDNNSVAHGIEDYRMADGTPIPTCYQWLEKNKDVTLILKGGFIRPEDVSKYAAVFDGFKIATRMHFLPRLPIRAYLKGGYPGVITDLLEPAHTHLFQPELCLPNSSLTEEWFVHTSNCKRMCHTCKYCETTAHRIARPFSEDLAFHHYLFDDESALQERLERLHGLRRS